MPLCDYCYVDADVPPELLASNAEPDAAPGDGLDPGETCSRCGESGGLLRSTDPDCDPRFVAVEAREQLRQIREETTPVQGAPEGLNETLGEAMRQIVEGGSMLPNESIDAEIPLTWRERLTGIRTQDMTAVFCLGLMLGAALERDVPAGTVREQAWRNGEYVLPEVSE